MPHPRRFVALLTAVLALSGCKKEIDTQIQVKEVAKKYSWTENIRLHGSERIVLNLGTAPDGLFLQQPAYFSSFVYRNGRLDYTAYVAGLTSDLKVRMPINGRFFAAPVNDSLVAIYNPRNPVITGFTAYIHLKQLDPAVARIARPFPDYSPFGAVNQNDYLLFGYENQASGRPFTFVLSRIQAPLVSGLPVRVSSQRVVIPRNPGATPFFRNITAVDDYFLVAIDGAGLYKVQQDGRVQRVLGPVGTDGIDAVFKWQGKVYATVEYNQLLVSPDDGATWTRYAGLPDYFNFTSYHVVQDSLVAVSHLAGAGNALFTLRFNGVKYTTRFLKNDGLDRAEVTSLAQLRDSVYIGTTSGLFVRPVNQFFESKP